MHRLTRGLLRQIQEVAGICDNMAALREPAGYLTFLDHGTSLANLTAQFNLHSSPSPETMKQAVKSAGCGLRQCGGVVRSKPNFWEVFMAAAGMAPFVLISS